MMKKSILIRISAVLLAILLCCSAVVMATDHDQKTEAEKLYAKVNVVLLSEDTLTIPEDTGTVKQQIVLVLESEIETTGTISFIIEDEVGKQLKISECKRSDQAILFEKDFIEDETGVYQLIGFSVLDFDSGEETEVIFDDSDSTITFTILTASDAAQIASITLDDSDTMEEDIAESVTTTIASAESTSGKSLETEAKDNVVVVLNPGHGGTDPGATYLYDGSYVYESTLNLKIAQACRDELQQYQGITVYMTREGDTTATIAGSVNYATSKGADLIVAIHNNASSSHDASGFEIYYPCANYRPDLGEEGRKVSAEIETELAKLGIYDRGLKTRYDKPGDENFEAYPDGSGYDYYGIINRSKLAGYVGIIIEHAFMDCSSDYYNFLSSDEKLKKLGVADATGIARYFGLSKTIAVESISLSSDTLDLTIGQTAALNAVIAPTNATNQTVTWSSGNPTVAKVENGLVTAVSVGSTEITATTEDGAFTASCAVQVACENGDLNEDGCINLSDARLAKSIVMKDPDVSGKYTTTGFNAGDLDHNGKITINEARKIKRAALGTVSDMSGVGTSNDTNAQKCELPAVTYHEITGTSSVTAEQLKNYFTHSGHTYPEFYNTNDTEAKTLDAFCAIYVEEAAAENIKVEVAFCQAMKETGWLQYGGAVDINQYNFGGLGATGGGASGASFSSVREGIRAQIQHLKAYANSDSLNNTCVDPRFNYVTRGSAPYVEWLGIQENPNGKGWATAENYGYAIVNMMAQIQ